MTPNIYKALPYYLKHSGALSALVSDRIYPSRLPGEATLPAITYQDVSSAYTQAHREAAALPRPRFQFTIHGGTVSSVDAVSVALKTALSGYRGNMGTGDYITKVEACLLKNMYSNDDQILPLYQRIQEYIIQWKE